ncbi:MAG: glycosyltransferase family 2 protein, partial [Gammaproteobacteria bacterium]|nr:glycosyltransferase family 2 protein [Gammaproteobacteria bacterium]
MPSNRNSLSIILPCYNETDSLAVLLAELKRLYSKAEIIVVDDGSNVPVAESPGVTVIQHPANLGNGAAIKTGTRHAGGQILVFMDSDGQHKPSDIERLLAKIDEGYDMAVGARRADTHASIARLTGNTLYNRLASWMTGYRIDDLTSGFRAARAVHFRKFLYLLPNRFSYPTTSTMAFFRCGHSVAYVPIVAEQRL